MRTRRSTVLGAVLLALALLAAACGDDDTTPASSGDVRQQTTEPSDPDAENPADDGQGTFPVTVTSNGVDTTIEQRPEAIVSLSPSATEMLYAIAAGDQVKAVDDNSNFPPDAPMTDLSAFDPNVESVIAQEPDLVVLSDDVNDVVAGLEAAGIPTIALPAASVVDDVYTQIEVLGAATGHVGSAAELVSTMQADIEELAAQAPDGEPLTYYHELDDQLFSVTSSTFIGEIYALAGLQNVADAADPAGEAGGYPQLSAEYLVDADPDLIFLADTKCCGQDATTLAARPGFDQLTAVREGRVVELDDDIASRWGPRIVDFLAAIVNATTTVEAG